MTRPNLQEDGFELVSAWEQHQRHPETFHLPPWEERCSLRPGDQAKLLVLLWGEEEGSPVLSCERLWVRVLEVVGGSYRGELLSQPCTFSRLTPGDELLFSPDHIADLLRGRAKRKRGTRVAKIDRR